MIFETPKSANNREKSLTTCEKSLQLAAKKMRQKFELESEQSCFSKILIFN